MSSKDARLARLQARLERLEVQMAALQPRRQASPPRASSRRPPTTAIVEDLMGRRAARYRRGSTRGALIYAGFIQVDERRYAWIKETAVPDLLDADAAAMARVLGAIASAVRIGLIRELFGRDRSSAELGAALGDVSPGHTYHHLKELQAAGVLLQVSRGVYRIAPPALIPITIMLAAAADVAGSRSAVEAEPFPSSHRAEST